MSRGSDITLRLLGTNFTDDVSAKTVDKMADFETLTLCISLNSSKMCNYFFQGLDYTILSVPGKKFDSQLLFIFKLISLPTPYCYGLDVTHIKLSTV